MEIAAAILATVLLTIAAIAISRSRGDEHQEDLNEHEGAPATGHAREEDEGRPAQPKADRPAGPDAEAMGVAEPGQPSVDPSAEREGERIVGEARRR
jgi:hypothetical protein